MRSSNTKIKIYQGNQIGGCVVSIETEKTKICIDFGENLPGNDEKEKIEIEGLTKPSSKIYDALFFTHYHGDHIGRMKEVLEDVPMYMGKTAKKVLLTINKTTKNNEMCEILKNKVSTFTENRPKKIGDIKITPYSIDHSAYDAYMFLIETPDKVILHTGDFRLHGYRGYKTLSLIRSYIKDFGKRKIDILITEGTMLSRDNEKYYSERQMLKDAKELMKKHKYIFLICSSTNLDSLATFYQAGQSQYPKRKMYANCYVYEQLKNFRETAGKRTSLYNFQNIEPIVFNYESKLQNRETITQEERMKKFGFVTIIKGTKSYEKWIERFKDCEEKPVVVYSMWNGYIEKGNKAYDKELANFCKKYKAIPMHTSGHIYPKDLEKVINTISPREAIIPIHTENGEGLKNLELRNYLKRRIKLNISEYEGKDMLMEDSRKVSEEMLNELKKGKFSEFIKFIKQNPKYNLALCFRGNSKEYGRESVIIYYNNHKVWELIKEDDNFYVRISFNHARYTEDWKDKLKELCENYYFVGENLKNIDINNAIKKTKYKKTKGDDSYQYTIGYLIAKNVNFNEKFVKETYNIIISLMEDYFNPKENPEENIDWFKSSYEGKKIICKRRNEYIEKRRQHELYLELNNSENGLYIHDLEFAQKNMPNLKKVNNQPDMHAIRLKNGKPESFVVIEVKSTESAMKDEKSGLKRHLEGMEEAYTKKANRKFVNNRLKEAFDIISQYQKLGIRPIKKFNFEKDLELYTSLNKIEIRFILTDGAASYYRRNKKYFKDGNLKNLDYYLNNQKHYEVDDSKKDRIEIWREYKI